MPTVLPLPSLDRTHHEHSRLLEKNTLLWIPGLSELPHRRRSMELSQLPFRDNRACPHRGAPSHASCEILVIPFELIKSEAFLRVQGVAALA